MRRVKAVLLVGMMLMAFCIIKMPSSVKANEGYAEAYIICLSGVPGWTFPDRSFDPSETKRGAIDALDYKEGYDLPLAHPKLGKTPPYYGISYYVIPDWSTYKGIIENYHDVIVINTHGEIIPVPSSYSRESWTDEVAEAMLNRRVTWVHTAGYPFRYAWYQGAIDKELWGQDGFKRLMSHINKSDVTCVTDSATELSDVNMNLGARETFDGWSLLSAAVKVQQGRPLKGSDFKNYAIQPIWGNENENMTGAAIAFVKPSERALPADRRGFGVYVHIGTNATYDENHKDTGGDYWRGYMGATAAIWTEVNTFNSFTATKEYTYAGGGSNTWGLTTTPVITHYDYSSSFCEISLSFGIYGFLKTNVGEGIGKIGFYLGDLPDGCMVQMVSHTSKNGYKYGSSNIVVDTWNDVKLAIAPLLYFIGLGATGNLALALTAIGGVILFSDYAYLANIPNKDNGVDETQPPNDYVQFSYVPETPYEQPGDGYTYWEFESLIYIELTVDMSSRQQWTIVPMEFQIAARDSSGGYLRLQLNGACSIAIFKTYESSNYRATVFFEDFSGSMDDWSMGDTNPLAGLDYWGVAPDVVPGSIRGFPVGKPIWCATVGNNSVKPGSPPNIQNEIAYDKCMDAYLERQIDLRPYRNGTIRLRYYLLYDICSGDFLKVEYCQYGIWQTVETLTGYAGTEHWSDEKPLPQSAETIRFMFHSNDDNNVGFGACIFYVQITAEMPNDANTNGDAGNDFDHTIYITYPNSYAGYINDDEDWYRFDVTLQNITDGKIIYVSIQKPEYTNFRIELYDKNHQIKRNSTNSIRYDLTPSDVYGQWRLRICKTMGFGPYAFRIELQTPSGGGGCPILLSWNGSDYVDYGVINIHNAEGYDVIKEVSISAEDLSTEGQIARLRLREGWEGLKYSHSAIDQVKLYAIDSNGNRHPCILIKATHSEQGSVLLKLLFSDNQRSDVYLQQTIDLQFIILYPTQMIRNFTFAIEGFNFEKIEY